MTNSNFLKKLLTTASVIAVSASAGSAFAENKVINKSATIGNGGAASVGVATEAAPAVDAVYNNGDNLKLIANNATFITRDAITLGTIDLNNKTPGLFTAAHATTLGSVINAGEQKLTTKVNDTIALTITGADMSALGNITLGSANANGATLNINSAVALGGTIDSDKDNESIVNVNENVAFANTIGATKKLAELNIAAAKTATLNESTSAKTIQLGDGSTAIVADGANITSTNIKGATADKGTLRFEGASTVNADKIGDTAKLNVVELAGAGTVDFKTTTAFDATTTLLSHEDAVLKFSAAETAKTNIKTAANTTGKIIIAEGTTLEGQFGEEGKSLAEINFSADKTLTLKKDESKLYANNVTTANDANGTIDITSAKFEIHSNIGANGASLKAVSISSDKVGNTATTVSLMPGKAIYATSVDLSKADNDNILKLHEGTKITGNVIATNANKGSLSIMGDSIIDGIIGTDAAINQITFDSANQLTVTKNAIKTATGVNFAEDGTLNLTENANVDINKTIKTTLAEGGTGSILVNEANNEKTIKFSVQVGDVAVKNNLLKLLQATGGADISLNEHAAIQKIDIGSQDSTLTLNKANGDFLIGEFAHEDEKGTLALSQGATLKAGTKLSSSAENPLKAVDLASQKLTVADGIDIHTSTSQGGGIRTNSKDKGTIIFEGSSIVSGVVGSNVALGDIEVKGKGKTVSFLNNVNLSALKLSKEATAVLNGSFIGENIQGENASQGTVRFNNSEALVGADKIKVKIGSTKLDTVELTGQDIKFADAKFDTDNLKFTESDASITFEALGADSLQNTTITTDSTTRQNNLLIESAEDQAFAKNLGTAENQLGYLKLSKDKEVTVNNDGFYADIQNAVKEKGTVTISKAGTSLGLGSENFELKATKINEDRTFKGDVWSKDIEIKANKTATFEKSVTGTNVLKLNNGSVATFNGDSAKLAIKTNAGAASEGTINFDKSITISSDIGTKADQLAAVNFRGKAGDVANLTSDIYADNIVVGEQTIAANKNLTLRGGNAFNGSTIDLGTNTVTLEKGNSTITGKSTINVTIDKDKEMGSIIVDGTDVASLNVNGVNNLSINISDALADLPTTDETYKLFAATNNGVLAALDAGKETINLTGHSFVEYSLDGNDLVRKNVASKTLTNELSAKPSLLQDALILVHPGNTGDAKSYEKDLSNMDSDQRKDSIARTAETTSVHANELSTRLMNTVTSTINNRMGAFSNHPQAGIQLASNGVSGVSGGEDVSMYGTWASPFYNQTTQKSRGGKAGYKSNTYGLTLGFDTKANADLTVGIAGTYAKSDVKMKDQKSGDKVKDNIFQLNVYGIQQLTDNWFLQGHAGYASAKIKASEKRVTALANEVANASYDVTSYNAEMLAGYNCYYAGATVTPLFGAGFTRINSSGYTETGTTNQNRTVKTKDTNKFEAVAGVRAQMETNMNGVSLTPEMHGFVRRDLIAKSGKTVSKLSGSAMHMTPQSEKTIKTTMNFGLGVNAVSGIYEYGVGYDLFAADKTLGHQGTLKVRVNF